MSVKVSLGKVNTDQFNMVAGSITLSALCCFPVSAPCLRSHTFSSCRLFSAFFLPSLVSVHVLFPSVQTLFFSVSCSVMTVLKLLPHLTSSLSLYLSSPVILSSSNHQPAAPFLLLLSLPLTLPRAHPLLLADN